VSNYQPVSKKLQDVVKEIDCGEMQLPEFQRDYNWKPAALISLIDSIQKNYPVGALLLLEIDPKKDDSPFGLRKFEGAPNPIEAPKFLVLDGQQRLSSCYQVLTGRGPRWYCLDLKELHKRHVSTDGAGVSFEDLLVKKKPIAHADTLLFNNDLMPLFFATDRKTMRTRLTQYEKNLLGSEDSEKVQLGEFVQEHLEGYLDVFYEYAFPAVVLPASLELEAVANVFTKLNTQGLKLSAFDLCVAALYPKGINLRAKLRDAWDVPGVRELDDDGTNLLQTLALLGAVPPKKAALVGNIKKSHVDDHWAASVAAMARLSTSLRQAGVWSSKTLPYDALVPPLTAAFVRTDEPKSPDKRAERDQKVRRLVVQTAFLGRYNEGTDVKQASDFGPIVTWLEGGAVPPFLEEHVVWTDVSHHMAKSGARAKALLAVLNQNRPGDLIEYTKSLGLGIEGVPNAEIHHIFPKAYLSGKGLAKEAERGLNLTFLSKESNNFINDRPPSKYLGEILAQWAKEGISEEQALKRLGDVMQRHLIDANGVRALLADDYEGFLRARGQALVTHLTSQAIPVLVTLDNDSSEAPADEDLDYGSDEFDDEGS
jgi:hypothetical protein